MEKVKEGRLNLNSGAEMCLTLWLAGKPVKAMLSRKTFYRYRLAVMKETGLDISLPAADQGKAIESIKMDLEYLKAHELKDVPAHLQLWLFKPGACPSWT